MSSFRLLDRQARRVAMAVVLLFTSVAPALVPGMASAAQVTTRSIQLSNSSAAAQAVTYKVSFTATATGAAGAFVVDFCSDSPLIGATCTPPTGFSASSAASTTSGFTDVTGSTSKITVAGTIANSQAVTVDVTGINNPTAAGPLYARIVTFDTKAHALQYTSTAPDTGATHVDDGGVAMNITNKIGVSAAVLETLQFCVSGQTDATTATNPIGSGCSGVTAPTLTLGELTGTVKALDSTHVSTGDIYTQLSTNAVGGAVVRLKAANTCGGLQRQGASVCDIAPALATDISAGQAKFGVKVAADTSKDTALSATGTLQAVTGSGYSSSAYALNYVANATSGITSIYGDPIIDTGDTPTQPSNKNMKLTFGASIANNTPAGLYKGDLSLIATGKF